MKYQTLLKKRHIALFFVILFMLFISLSLLPHTHSSADADCFICFIAEVIKNISALLVLIFSLSSAIEFYFYQTKNSKNISKNINTLVGLKVKLSD